MKFEKSREHGDDGAALSAWKGYNIVVAGGISAALSASRTCFFSRGVRIAGITLRSQSLPVACSRSPKLMVSTGGVSNRSMRMLRQVPD